MVTRRRFLGAMVLPAVGACASLRQGAAPRTDDWDSIQRAFTVENLEYLRR